jgi:hypothetical protein
MVRYHKLDGPVSLRTAEASGQQHKQWVCKMVVSVDGSGASQSQIGPWSKASANDGVKHDTKRCPQEATTKQNKARDKKTETKTEAEASSQQSPNWTI